MCNAGGSIMTTPKLVLLGLVSSILVVPPARAQVTIDVSKITCEQFISWSVTDPRYIILWLHGYHNGKRNNTLVDQESLKEDASKVRDYCRSNRERTVMQAVETVGLK
jgi:acid stress chaperone HdeB